jgi:manganese transport protein
LIEDTYPGYVAILMLNKKEQKPLDMTIGGLLLLVAIVYVAELLFAHPSGVPLTAGILVPTVIRSIWQRAS